MEWGGGVWEVYMRMYCDTMIVLFMPGWYYRLIEVRLLVGWLIGYEGLEYDTMGWRIWHICADMEFGLVLGLRRSLNELRGVRIDGWIDRKSVV